MLNTHICRDNCIVGDGDCFFHALEYAIGPDETDKTCPLIPYNMRYIIDKQGKKVYKTLTLAEKMKLINSERYRKTREEVSKQPMIQIMIQEKKNEKEEKEKERDKLISSLQSISNSNFKKSNNVKKGILKNENSNFNFNFNTEHGKIEHLNKNIEELEREIKYFENFGDSYDYADDFMIQQTAIYKKKILLIVQESDTDPLVVFIQPEGVELKGGVPLKELDTISIGPNNSNVVVLLRKGGNTQHYITFDRGSDRRQYINNEFMNMLIKFKNSNEGFIEEVKGKGAFVKHASLKTLLSFHEPLIKKMTFQQEQRNRNKTRSEQTNKTKNNLTLKLRENNKASTPNNNTNLLIKQIQEQDKKDEEKKDEERKAQEKKNSNFAKQIQEQEEAFRLINQESKNREIARKLQEDQEEQEETNIAIAKLPIVPKRESIKTKKEQEETNIAIAKLLQEDEQEMKRIQQEKQEQQLRRFRKKAQEKKEEELRRIQEKKKEELRRIQENKDFEIIKKRQEEKLRILKKQEQNRLPRRIKRGQTYQINHFGGTRKRKIKKKTFRKSSRRKSLKPRRTYRSR